MPVSLGLRCRDDARDIAVGDELHRGAGFADAGDDLLVPRTVEHEGADALGLHALGPGERHDVVGGFGVEIDDAFGESRPDGDLVHIDVGRVQQRSGFRHGHDGDRIGKRLGAQRGAFQRIERDVDLQPARADLLADEQHGRLVALALADHHGAVDGKQIERPAHAFDGRLVRRVLVAPSGQLEGAHGGGFRHAHRFQRENAIQRSGHAIRS